MRNQTKAAPCLTQYDAETPPLLLTKLRQWKMPDFTYNKTTSVCKFHTHQNNRTDQSVTAMTEFAEIRSRLLSWLWSLLLLLLLLSWLLSASAK